VAAAAVLLLVAGAGWPSDQSPAWRLEGVAVKALAALGAAAAAFAFGPRSRLRPAWATVAVAYALLAAKTFPVAGGDLLPAHLGTLAANLLAPLGSFLMVRAWYGAGLTPAIPLVRRWALPALTFALALAVAGPSLVADVRRMGHDPSATLLVFSWLGDIASITLLAPLLLIALAMRGGRLAWPWGLLAAGEVCWLLYDLVPSLAPGLVSSVDGVRALAEVMRSSACLLHAAAGLAQVLVLGPAPAADPRAAPR
jgi:hypothetical protein